MAIEVVGDSEADVVGGAVSGAAGAEPAAVDSSVAVAAADVGISAADEEAEVYNTVLYRLISCIGAHIHTHTHTFNSP